MEAIKCVFISEKDFPEVLQLARRNFLADEPLCSSLNLADSTGLDDYFRHSVEQGTSVMAIDTANNNKIVGVRAHRVVTKDEETPSGQSSDSDDSSSNLLMDLVDYMIGRYNPWKELGVDKILHFKYLLVHPEYRGRNIGAIMTKFTFDFMQRENIPVAYVLATSIYSQAVFKKTGFQVVDEVNYADYKKNGKRVFEPAPIHQSCMTLVKWV